MVMTGAQIVIEALLEHGVDTIFGYPGGSVIHIYDELYKRRNELRHYTTCHEQGAVHAADSYARVTGKPGIVFATSGPGATNLVTGIANAYLDSSPVIAITGNVATNLLGRDSFQEVDISGITMPITKHNYIVKDIRVLADTIHDAFSIACSGRPGPVLIDITKDVQTGTIEYEPSNRPAINAVPPKNLRISVRKSSKRQPGSFKRQNGPTSTVVAALSYRMLRKNSLPLQNTSMLL